MKKPVLPIVLLCLQAASALPAGNTASTAGNSIDPVQLDYLQDKYQPSSRIWAIALPEGREDLKIGLQRPSAQALRRFHPEYQASLHREPQMLIDVSPDTSPPNIGGLVEQILRPREHTEGEDVRMHVIPYQGGPAIDWQPENATSDPTPSETLAEFGKLTPDKSRERQKQLSDQQNLELARRLRELVKAENQAAAKSGIAVTKDSPGIATVLKGVRFGPTPRPVIARKVPEVAPTEPGYLQRQHETGTADSPLRQPFTRREGEATQESLPLPGGLYSPDTFSIVEALAEATNAPHAEALPSVPLPKILEVHEKALSEKRRRETDARIAQETGLALEVAEGRIATDEDNGILSRMPAELRSSSRGASHRELPAAPSNQSQPTGAPLVEKEVALLDMKNSDSQRPAEEKTPASGGRKTGEGAHTAASTRSRDEEESEDSITQLEPPRDSPDVTPREALASTPKPPKKSGKRILPQLHLPSGEEPEMATRSYRPLVPIVAAAQTQEVVPPHSPVLTLDTQEPSLPKGKSAAEESGFILSEGALVLTEDASSTVPEPAPQSKPLT
ncbi:MAG: hypothetical protein HQL31_04230, partial [Planctomycetes bacterium]|nr:hypothetical protein [Planctomycetota bacterium]